MGTQLPLPKGAQPPPNCRPISVALHTAAWIKVSLGMELGLSAGDFVLDGDAALPSPKKAEHPCPIFGPCLLWPNDCMHQDATWYRGRPQPGDFVLDGDPAPSPIFGPFLLWPTAGCIKMPLGMDADLSPEDFVLDGDPVPLPKKGVEPSPKFSAHVICFLPYSCEEAICLCPDSLFVF